MTDIEKVIKALECYERTAGERCKNCPYADSDMCIEEMSKDALDLLKEQEPVEMEIEGGGASWWYVCEECHGSVDYYDSFCRHCGRPFKKKKSACDGCEYKGSDDCIQGQPGSENAYCPNGKLG